MNRTFARSALAAFASIGLALPLVLPLAPATASAYATGEVTLGNSTIEPAFDAATGDLMYLLTPNKAPMKAPMVTWAPLYIPVYPASDSFSTPLNCMHLGGDNCPDHGPEVAGAAMAIMPSVYGGGVLGHDHVGDAPGGSDFNFQWVPVLVLFTDPVAAQTRVTTDAAIAALVANQQAIEIPLDGTNHAPFAVFNCSVVSSAVYMQGTPVPSV